MSVADVVKAITVTAELTGASLSGAAIAVMAQDLLSAYPEDAVTRALSRCRRELSRPLTTGAVFDRLCENDGRPGVEEAWAMCPKSEADSVCWTLEMREAFSIARSLMGAGDMVGARMAFKDAYERIVRESRENGFAARWELSLGWDESGRQRAVEKAVAVKAISAECASAYLPPPSSAGINLIECLSGKETLRLNGPDYTPSEVETIRERLASLKQMLGKKSFSRNKANAERLERERAEFAKRKEQAANAVRERMGG